MGLFFEILQLDLDRFAMSILGIVYPELLEIACDDPAGTHREGQFAIISAGLLIRSEDGTIGLDNALTEVFIRRFLLNKYACGRDIGVDIGSTT